MNLAGAACAAPVFFLSMEIVGSPGKNRIAEMKQQEKEARGRNATRRGPLHPCKGMMFLPLKLHLTH
jgi:hypothetical protein